MDKRGNPRALTYGERKTIGLMVQKGLTYRTIAHNINRHIDTIKHEISHNGGPSSYCPHKAQESYLNRKAAGVQKRPCAYTPKEKQSIDECVAKGFTFNKTSIETGVSYYRVGRYINKFYPGYKPSSDTIKQERVLFGERLSSLEMQIQILFEQIKELNKCLK